MFQNLIKLSESKARYLKVRLFDNPDHWIWGGPLIWERDILGKITVLFFWHGDSIHSLNALEWLEKLRSEFIDQPLLIIGVYIRSSAASARHAVLREQISFPVYHDYDSTILKKFNITACPTVCILGPQGNILHPFFGEEWRYSLRTFIADAFLFYHFGESLPSPTCLHPLPGELRYPMGLLWEPNRSQLIVSGTGSCSLLIMADQGRSMHRIGSGKRGYAEGSFDEACFHSPVGLAWTDGKLYVADRGNHAIRTVDLDKHLIQTFAGTGREGYDLYGKKDPRYQELNAPWAIAAVQGTLYVAMAGLHQLWSFNTKSGYGEAWSGTGSQISINADHLLASSWSFPSALIPDGSDLYVVDYYTQTIRKINLATGVVESVIIHGLRGPMGGCWSRSRQTLFIANRQNHTVIEVDPKTGKVFQQFGSGLAGFQDGQGKTASFFEPCAVAVDDTREILYVADCNNHAIRQIDLRNSEISTLNREENEQD